MLCCVVLRCAVLCCVVLCCVVLCCVSCAVLCCVVLCCVVLCVLCALCVLCVSCVLCVHVCLLCMCAFKAIDVFGWTKDMAGHDKLKFVASKRLLLVALGVLSEGLLVIVVCGVCVHV